MHHLLICDPQFAYVKLRHCAAPAAFNTLKPVFEKVLARKLPASRGVDSLPMGLDAPQGDDFLLAGLTPFSIYYAYTFPAEADRVFNKALMFADVSPPEIAEWRETYLRALRSVACEQGKRRIVSRNASNTTRIPEILKMFPEARFVHMRRHPEPLFAAQAQRWSSLTGNWALTSVNHEQLRVDTLKFYEQMMQRYLHDRERVPADQLCEVDYDELRQAPIQTMQRVYDSLRLGDFAPVRPRVEQFLSSGPGQLSGDEVELCESDLDIVRDRWAFAYRAFGYTRPTASPVQ